MKLLTVGLIALTAFARRTHGRRGDAEAVCYVVENEAEQ